MNRRFRALAVCAAVSTLIVQAWLAAPALALPKHFSLAWDPAYAKECGVCHMAYPPQLLPSEGWRKIMSNLGDHFGESAQLDAALTRKLTDFLVANSAEHAANQISIEVMQSIKPGAVPDRITGVPFIAGLHSAMLDPRWGGNPRPKTLAECGVCHYQVEAGDFTYRRFTVTDEQFREQAR
ncbi:MAG TPA: hypothetical protein VMV45_05910 [Casimicrobiaceae bacterium]|nr:hypothetical protein [Casimicrobiaceae bacterium]